MYSRLFRFVPYEANPECSIVTAGDALINRRLSVYEGIDSRFDGLMDQIEKADISVVNLETLLHNYEEGYPASTDVSSIVQSRSPPWVADELGWAGFDMFAVAHNHAGDYSHGGMISTMRELERRKIPYAGLGRNLAEARKPAYIDTKGGRAALIAACTSIKPGTAAGAQRPDMQGRPGVSPLRAKTEYVLPPNDFNQVKMIGERLGLDEERRRRQAKGFFHGTEEGVYRFLNATYSPDLFFKRGEETHIDQRLDENDVADVIRQVKRADGEADWVVVSLHVHFGDQGRYNDDSVPGFLEEFVRECAGAGADVFFAHGPHQIRGMEVVEGMPAFYSLGNFVMQHDLTTRFGQDVFEAMGAEGYDVTPYELHAEVEESIFPLPDRMMGDRVYWESILPVCQFANGGLAEIKLYPFEMGYDLDRPRRGFPLLAEGNDGKRIIERLEELSKPYGTEISFDEGVGLVEAG